MAVIKEEIRDHIIEAARGIFSRFGFKKTTMDEIAMAMHKGKSSIYYYFISKEEIFAAVVEKEANILRNDLHNALKDISDPKEKLKAYITTRMYGFKRLSNFYEAIKSDYLSHLDFINKIRVKYDENEIKNISDILQEGLNAEIFKIDDINLASIAIFTAIKGLEIPLFWSVDDHDLDKRIDSLLSILFYGMAKR